MTGPRNTKRLLPFFVVFASAAGFLGVRAAILAEAGSLGIVIGALGGLAMAGLLLLTDRWLHH